MDETSLSNPSTSCKAFRAHISKSHNSSILHQQEITHASWSRFWRLALTTVQRNVMYRLLHRLIPTVV
ncbi:uncharacterized protein B0P05DRAFT_527725, partial [Gilbertella persicaria]|uniref:uncharacterized protein n=1 Tax=Gilbertella persicaria TaxID=101096 RepID=UPI00221F45CC